MKRIDHYWYSNNRVSNILKPLSWLFCTIVYLRKLMFRLRILSSYRSALPVIVVGNITVGGTGKTPMVIWLAKQLKQAGYKPGIISRGYGGHASHWPQQVRPDSDPYVVGDEPLLIAQRTGCPMAVGPSRVDAAHAINEFTDCDVLISDDGMQHYRLRRDMEICIIDGKRRFGNGLCLPAGPLREKPNRLKLVDFIVTNSNEPVENENCMQLAGGIIKPLSGSNDVESLTEWKGRRVHAIAGIGNPQRFFDALRSQGLNVIEHAYSDHYHYRQHELEFYDSIPVIMTEKDAVKYRRFAGPRHWYYPVDAILDDGFAVQILERLKVLKDG